MTRLAGRWLLAIVLIWVPALHAAPITFFTTMSGAQESPPNASPGTGFAVVIFDPVAHTMSVHAEFADLLSPTTVAHIHCCVVPPDTTAAVATTTPTFPGFPAGVTEGEYDAVFDMTLASSYRAGFITDNGGTTAGAEAALFAGLLAGAAYFNIHTSQFPAGEIRGFLAQVVPEPATLALLGMAILAAGAMRRRRL